MAESYPTWLAGEDITADKLNLMLPKVARKTLDESVTSSTVQQDDDELFFSVEANAVYIMDGWIKYGAATAGDIDIDWTAPTGSLGEWTAVGIANDTAAAGTGYSVQMATQDIEASRSFGGVTGSTFALHIKGTLRTASTAGTYQMTWAQLASSATATTVYTDSWLRLQRIA